MTNPKDEAASEFEKAYEEFRHKHINASFMPKEMAKFMFLAGMASKGIRFPSEEQQRKFVELRFCYSGLEYNSWPHVAKDAVELLKKFCDEIKALNEGGNE